ncbi:MAG TPA: XRE family transcriptional regulator, partial [Pilimelia sp.]|nr:XRE family transcriptional regulator [Pilimelia sp.]
GEGRPDPVGMALPPPVRLVGREREVAELTALLAQRTGPVSLVGVAGVGKSSLAIAVAHRLAHRYPGGLAGVLITERSTEPDVFATVAAVFGVARAEDLPGRFARAPALLVVDAVERAPAAVAAALRRLATDAPAVQILATGRRPVGVAGERVWPVAPLDVPPPDPATDLATAGRYPAVELFLARLRLIRQAPLAGDEVGALVTLVRRLGGLPLALELAAARGRVLGLHEILDRYGDRVLDLAGRAADGEVTGTLRDAVLASYRLLRPDEQYALRRLSTFRNRWSVDLAEAVLTDEGAPDGGHAGGDLVPTLDRLLVLGMVSARGTGALRFRLLDVVRDLAEEEAARAGEASTGRRRHAVVLAGLAARLAPRLVGASRPAAVAQLDELAADIWAALAFAADDDPATALGLAAALPRWWRFRGLDVQGRRWLRRLLDDPRTVDASPGVRAWAAVGAARLATEHGAGAAELAGAEAALTTFQRQGDVAGELAARAVLCSLLVAVGGAGSAREHCARMLALASRAGQTREVAVAQHGLAVHDLRAGNLGTARRRLAAADRLGRQCGEDRLRAVAWATLAEVARLEGRYAEAEVSGRRAAALLAESGDPGHRRRALGTVGLALAQLGRVEDAATVVAELRRPYAERSERAGEPPVCASIEGHLAVQRGDRRTASERFVAAARAHAGGHELREVAEALVRAVATTPAAADRADLLKWLDDVCADGGIVLLAHERAMIRAADGGARLPRQRRPLQDPTSEPTG